MVVQVAQIVQVAQVVQIVQPVQIVQLVIIAINVQIAKLVTQNAIQIISDYLAPSHAYPLPAWQLPPELAVKRLHDQLCTSLHS